MTNSKTSIKTKKSEEKKTSTKKVKPSVDTDITNLENNIEKLKIHFSKNKHDYSTKVSLSKKQAKLRKLKAYKKKKNK